MLRLWLLWAATVGLVGCFDSALEAASALSCHTDIGVCVAVDAPCATITGNEATATEDAQPNLVGFAKERGLSRCWRERDPLQHVVAGEM
jgi:hypothetical protein